MKEMDKRVALKPGKQLDFPGMTCTIEEEIGRGSNAIVYKASYPDLMNPGEIHTVLVKELFPLHPKGAIARDAQDDILCGEEARELMEIHRRSFESGNVIHLRMLQKHPEQIGANLNTFSLHNTNYSVLGYTGGRSLEQELSTGEQDLRQLTVRILKLLDALEAFHENAYLHLDISPDNVLLVGRKNQEQVMLIDFNSVLDFAQTQAPTYSSIKAGYSAPEIRTGQRPTAAADLYSVVAVFYFGLTGKALTAFDVSRPTPPNVSDCACLLHAPETAKNMVRQILCRGLQSLPRRRYQTVAEMRTAFQELLDRVDGVGITHWALWESGRRIVNRMIRENPSFSYLQNGSELFFSNVQDAGGTMLSMQEFMEKLRCGERMAALLTGAGGMGKTTAMMRLVFEQPDAYMSNQPAVIYLPLHGYREGQSSFIRDRILENMHFKPDQRSFEDARHALNTLLNSPLQTRQGNRPILLLLLDGLNETGGNAQPLLDEINELAQMQGVSLLISSRTQAFDFAFPVVKLEALSTCEVEKCLASHGMLQPESPTMRELLKTPLMLSVFVHSALAEEKQLVIKSKEELLDAYLNSMLTKETKTENPDARWQIEAAVYLVLPALAAAMNSGSASDRTLLKTVSKAYKLFSGRLLIRAFPQWIGHTKAIRGDAKTAEDWYGRIVHDILWKRLGLLVRNEQNEYQIAHQIIGEYLSARHQVNQKRIWRKRQMGIGIGAALAVLLAIFSWGGYLLYLKPCDEQLAESVISMGASAYGASGNQYEAMMELLDHPDDENQVEVTLHTLDNNPFGALNLALAQKYLSMMQASGKTIPWSHKSFDSEHYLQLIELPPSRVDAYRQWIDVLLYVQSSPSAQERYGSFPDLLRDLIETDAKIAALLFNLACEPHVSGSREEAFLDLYVGKIEQEAVRKNLDENLSELEAQRNRCLSEINRSGVMEAYSNRM